MNENVNINGILNLYKTKGATSHDMVGFIRRTLHIKRVGHAGTLDPIACGVLPIMIGNATKLSQILTDHDKVYKAKIKFGLTTDTQDITGEILSSICAGSVAIPSESEIISAAATFKGNIQQMPPMYSAIKINGSKLYDLARAGIEVERKTRNVRIYDISVKPTIEKSEYILTVSCSKGTYIRTLCHDIGQVLKCGAVMTELERVQCGDFSVTDSITCEEFANVNTSDIQNFIVPVEKLLSEKYDKKIVLDEFNYKLIRNGVHVSLEKILTALSITEKINEYSVSDKVLLYTECQFFALGEVIWSDTEERLLLKSSMIFE